MVSWLEKIFLYVIALEFEPMHRRTWYVENTDILIIPCIPLSYPEWFVTYYNVST